MTWKKLVLLCGLLCVSSQSTAQEKPSDLPEIVIVEETQQRLFESTYWMPKRGVTLLEQKYAIKAWNRMREKPCFRNVSKSAVHGLVVFKTEHLYIFAYRNMLYSDWIVCKKNGDLDFQAYSISGGPSYDNPKKGSEGCSAGNNGVNVRFRSYEKNGPLLLEVNTPGCRILARYEFLFALDGEELQEVLGSRFVVDQFNRDDGQGWFYWPVEFSDHKRFEKLSWNDDGELQWQKALHKVPKQFHDTTTARYKSPKIPKVKQFCHYESKSKSVKCRDKIQKRINLTTRDIYRHASEHYPIKEYSDYLEYLKLIEKLLPSTFKELGYYMSTDEKKEFKNHIKEIESRVAQEVKTTTR